MKLIVKRTARPTRIRRDKNLGTWGGGGGCVFVDPAHAVGPLARQHRVQIATVRCTEMSRRAMLFNSHGAILVILQVRFSPWIRSRQGK
jgi:hypothetical protein